MDKFLIGLGSGLLLALIVFMIMEIKLRSVKSTAKADNDKLKSMLTDRMEIESEGITRLKSENEKLKKENENLRISIQTYSQKPGRKELQRLQVYQTAVDRLIINSPGFGAAWQAALKDSEIEFEKTYIGVQSFIKKLIPMKTDAAVIKEIDES